MILFNEMGVNTRTSTVGKSYKMRSPESRILVKKVTKRHILCMIPKDKNPNTTKLVSE